MLSPNWVRHWAYFIFSCFRATRYLSRSQHLLHLQKIVLVGPGPVRKNLLAWSASAFKCSQAHTSAMDFPDISRSMYLLHILPRTNLSMSFFVLHGFGHLVHYDCLLRFKKYISFEFSWGCILLSIESQSLHCPLPPLLQPWLGLCVM